ncbi:FtsX-like permease family protein, partial [Paenibacillus alkaliterrae]|uniref:FtsX-like permease family protein n=1 Tax=Paenibacillus alkaliterrae TaxID=320909 RepID=UPI0039F05FED
MNDRLFNKGLRDLGTITKLSFSLQVIILIISTLSMVTMISFYNTNKGFKYAILKSLGSTDRHLYWLSLLQTSYIFVLGTLFSLPLMALFHYVIIRGTYSGSIWNNESFREVMRGTLIWLVVLYGFMLVLSFLSIRAQRDKSMKQSFEGNMRHDSHPADHVIVQMKSFHTKQLLGQLLLYPKRTLLSLLTMSVSILVILFAVTFAKEAAGIWTTDIDYYLSSQEDIYSKVVDGHTVLVSKDVTYSPAEVRQLQAVKGIAWIDKEPSMLNVMPVLKREDATATILSWIKKYA